MIPLLLRGVRRPTRGIREPSRVLCPVAIRPQERGERATDSKADGGPGEIRANGEFMSSDVTKENELSGGALGSFFKARAVRVVEVNYAML